MGIKPQTAAVHDGDGHQHQTAAVHDGDGHQHREATWLRTAGPHRIWVEPAWHNGFNANARVAKRPMLELGYQSGRSEFARDEDQDQATRGGRGGRHFHVAGDAPESQCRRLR